MEVYNKFYRSTSKMLLYTQQSAVFIRLFLSFAQNEGLREKLFTDQRATSLQRVSRKLLVVPYSSRKGVKSLEPSRRFLLLESKHLTPGQRSRN